jgi:hypothetical protein
MMPVQVTHPLFANTTAGCSARTAAPIAGNIIHFLIENAPLRLSDNPANSVPHASGSVARMSGRQIAQFRTIRAGLYRPAVASPTSMYSFGHNDGAVNGESKTLSTDQVERRVAGSRLSI